MSRPPAATLLLAAFLAPACSTALNDAGIIEQVPQVLYAVTTGRPRRIETPLGSVSLHRLPAPMMFGYGCSASTFCTSDRRAAEGSDRFRRWRPKSSTSADSGDTRAASQRDESAEACSIGSTRS
jgi:hypothetical protein